MTLTGALGLRQHIWLQIVVPKTTEQSIKEKAKALGFGNTLNKEQVTEIYANIHSDLIERITAFMHSDEACGICKHVNLCSPRASFSNDISKRLMQQIFDIYGIDLFYKYVQPIQPQPLSSWLWSLLGY